MDRGKPFSNKTGKKKGLETWWSEGSFKWKHTPHSKKKYQKCCACLLKFPYSHGCILCISNLTAASCPLFCDSSSLDTVVLSEEQQKHWSCDRMEGCREALAPYRAGASLPLWTSRDSSFVSCQ